MIFKIKYIFLLSFLGFVGWFSWSIYNHFFDASVPQLSLNGLDASDYYSGDVQCTVSSNKEGNISVWLDGQSLINRYRMRRRGEEQTFTIPTKTISNGRHLLKAEFIDSTFRKNKTIIEREFNVDNIPLQAAFVRPDADYKVFQGRTLHIQFQVNKEIKEAKIHTLASTYNCFQESKKSLIYEAFIPIECDEIPNEYLFSVEIADKVGNKLNLDNKFQIVMYPFKKQKLYISDEKVQKERDLAGSDHFDQKIDEITKKSSQEKLWRGTFCTPIDIDRVTCEFGTIRTTQHKGRYAHKALDIINTPKSVVWSTQDGIVALKERFEGSGNTVVIDHGLGVMSLFFHLDDFANIEVGQKIAKGNPVGTLGKTGYATGYHLHWEMRVNNIAVDPIQWTKTTF